jgi:hypothetical protein
VGVALWVDPVVHAAECQRFDSYVVKGPRASDCDIFTGAIGKDGYGFNRAELHLLRAALAITLASNVIAASAASAGRWSTVGAGGGGRTGYQQSTGPAGPVGPSVGRVVR